MDHAQFVQKVIDDLQNGRCDIQTDNAGQLVIYTGYWEQKDESIEETPDPNWEEP